MLEEGRIGAVLPPGTATGVPVFDAVGGQAWPPFADLHTHFDKGQIWHRAPNADGTLDTARAQVRADTIARWTADDVEARFEFSLKAAYAQGTAAIRTHIDCLVPGQAATSFSVFRRLRARWAGRITLQAAALVSPDLYDVPENAAIVDLAAEAGASLGGITHCLDPTEDPAILDGRLDPLFAIAAARGLDVDLHVDENGVPASATLGQIAQAVLRSGFRGRVVSGHCCSLSVQNEAIAARSIGLAAKARIMIVSLPLVNQYLQGRRPGATPIWRGIPLLRELRAAGVPVALASDNCRDSYHPFGDLDLLAVLGGGIRIGHLDAEMARWATAVTAVPGAVIGGQSGQLRVGEIADLLVFRGRSFSELFARPQSDRLVIRNGQPIDTTCPTIVCSTASCGTMPRRAMSTITQTERSSHAHSSRALAPHPVPVSKAYTTHVTSPAGTDFQVELGELSRT